MSKRRKPQHASPRKIGRRTIDGYLRLADARHRLVERHGYAYDSYGAFLREHGEDYVPARAIPWAPRACFGNAIAFAAVYGWTYVEGIAVPRAGGRAFGHAWCVDEHGEAVEVTWPFVGAAYLGVPFSVGRADDATWHGNACVLDDANRQWPLLRERWTGEDFEREWPDQSRLRQLRVIALTDSGRQGLTDAGAPDPWPYLLATPVAP